MQLLWRQEYWKARFGYMQVLEAGMLEGSVWLHQRLVPQDNMLPRILETTDKFPAS